jgi:uncharacterized protein YciI
MPASTTPPSAPSGESERETTAASEHWPRTPYALVLLREGPRFGQIDAYAQSHERFVDSLIRRNLILLGGAIEGPSPIAHAAYILRCDDLEQARALAADDPLVVHEIVRVEVFEWQLVAINPEAIAPSAVITPADV